MPWKEQPIKKVYYKIGEVATILEEATSLIRYWEAYFRINPKRNINNVRYYSDKQLLKLMEIKRLVKGRRYTLEGAKQVLYEEKHHII